MKISLSMHKQRLKLWAFSFVAAFAMLLPFSAFSQDEQQDEQDLNSGGNYRQAERPAPSAGGTPWENSRRASARPDYTTPGTTGAASRPAAARPVGGATVDLVDPGGPPDVEVPLDENLTLIFLAGAIVFAFWVAKKRMTAKAVAVKNDK
jgi:hypothetical protein